MVVMRSLLPPTLVAILVAFAVGIGWLVPILRAPPGWWRVLGLAPLAAGLLLAMRSAALFDRRNTNIHTFRDPDHLVIDGAFRWSRNPMYLGFAIVLAGVAVIVGAVSGWIAPLAFVFAAARWYIPYEEQRMTEHFGPDYVAYKQGTRRWFGRR